MSAPTRDDIVKAVESYRGVAYPRRPHAQHLHIRLDLNARPFVEAMRQASRAADDLGVAVRAARQSLHGFGMAMDVSVRERTGRERKARSRRLRMTLPAHRR